MLCEDCDENVGTYRILFGKFLCDATYNARIAGYRLRLYDLLAYRKIEFLIKTQIKSMDHPFTPSANDLVHCRICKRVYKSHTDNVECESCNFVGKCNVYENMLLCDSCIEKSKKASEEVVKTTEVLVEDSKALIDRANKIQDNIKYSGDFFNAETVAFIEVKKAYLNDASIPEAEREFAFHKYLVETIEQNQKKIFDNNTENLTLTVQNSSAINILRDYGDKVREEHRERIKQSDAMYSPLNVKPVKVSVKKASPTNALERIIEQYALSMNVSKEIARQVIEGGMQSTRKAEDKIGKEGV